MTLNVSLGKMPLALLSGVQVVDIKVDSGKGVQVNTGVPGCLTVATEFVVFDRAESKRDKSSAVEPCTDITLVFLGFFTFVSKTDGLDIADGNVDGGVLGFNHHAPVFDHTHRAGNFVSVE